LDVREEGEGRVKDKLSRFALTLAGILLVFFWINSLADKPVPEDPKPRMVIAMTQLLTEISSIEQKPITQFGVVSEKAKSLLLGMGTMFDLYVAALSARNACEAAALGFSSVKVASVFTGGLRDELTAALSELVDSYTLRRLACEAALRWVDNQEYADLAAMNDYAERGMAAATRAAIKLVGVQQELEMPL
jgi:hypothetical protein